ncbi:MAG: M28 family peptidase [Gemmatimonadaceae bacterium]
MTAPEPPLDGEAARLLRLIGAHARPTGSAAESAARRVCAEWLAEAGFDVEEPAFTYSAWPGTWGTLAVGLALLLNATILLINISRGTSAGHAVAWALCALVPIVVGAWWLGRYGTRKLPFLRRSGVNLEARRRLPEAGANTGVNVWLVAHLDSKSQPMSLLLRSAASIAAGAAWIGLAVALGPLAVYAASPGFAIVLAACAAIAAVPLLFSRPGTEGAGALDNASGVASIVLAARRIDQAGMVGVVLTSAEEFGLAGARAWVEGRMKGVAINCDGVDDRGKVSITAGFRGRELIGRVRKGVFLGPEVRIRRSLPGILLDATAFSDRGWAACTISQGTLGSLARVHTRGDTLDSLTGAGVERTAAVIASLAGAIIAGEGPTANGKEIRNPHGTATP